MLRYYLPEIANIFRIKPMPRNRVQHQKGLSDDAFERLYPDEDACRKAWFAWRWPEGFKCPRCAGSTYCEIRGVNCCNATLLHRSSAWSASGRVGWGRGEAPSPCRGTPLAVQSECRSAPSHPQAEARGDQLGRV